ncbi:pyridoxal 5'-phosphate synthase [Cellulomonas sp. ATA003]|uniref:pyridoxine/pyridoxamine 5'-phosphate oxidase n=1 Tax=Cellulomonas sp. ATA003 TaxID=3073064 RepID=UPI0028737CF6|nr:pyridoxal 5'-phosphate synthase [Cellulomonas sp. ATA003]WNB84675.1 pyridoxal 5'-phosphate synthase [Cellulomonas sp. ATA003]
MSTDQPDDVRSLLRSLRVFAGDLPRFDPDDAAPTPQAMFVAWLRAAADAGVREPHAVTVSTADGDGRVSARVVVLHDVVDGAWRFATDSRSRKVLDVDANPRAALSFYWREQARQVRLEGTVRRVGAEASAADFLARSPASRAAGLATRPGEPLGSVAELRDAMGTAAERVDREPGTVLPEWTLLELVPDEAEFWQGDPGRAHTRVVYRRGDDGWTRGLVWP